MRALSGWTWAGGALVAAVAAVSCGPSVTVEPCACSGGASGTAGSVAGTGGAGAGAAQTTATGMAATCGDGIIEPSDHCDDPSNALHCAADCAPGVTVDAGTGGDCAGHVYYAGKLDGAVSVWASLPSSQGMTGLAAGNTQCAALGIGADHVCDYEEVLLAQADGELSLLPQGTNAWVQRTTTALVNGEPSAPGLGGNCNDWTYPGGHVANGEYLIFEQTGVPTFHLDDDTIFDPSMGDVHTNPTDLHCYGEERSIFCCYQACP